MSRSIFFFFAPGPASCFEHVSGSGRPDAPPKFFPPNSLERDCSGMNWPFSPAA